MLALHQSDGSLSLLLSLHSQKGKLIVGGWWGPWALHLPPCGYLILWQVILLREKKARDCRHQPMGMVLAATRKNTDNNQGKSEALVWRQLFLSAVKVLWLVFRDSWLCLPSHFYLDLLFFIPIIPDMFKFDSIPSTLSSVWGSIWHLWECFVLNIVHVSDFAI